MLRMHGLGRVAFTGVVFFLASGIGEASSPPQPAPGAFECVLPYVSGGGMVTIVSASGADQAVHVTVMNAYRYTVVVPKNSSYSFQSPVYQGFFVPIVHGGPISFKSDQPVVVYTLLAQDSVTIQCSDPTKRTKVFVGNPNTGVAMANVTKAPIGIQIYRDDEQTPALSLTLAADERKLAFLRDLVPDTGQHAYRVVAEGDGVGVSAISYKESPASAIPMAEK